MPANHHGAPLALAGLGSLHQTILTNKLHSILALHKVGILSGYVKVVDTKKRRTGVIRSLVLAQLELIADATLQLMLLHSPSHQRPKDRRGHTDHCEVNGEHIPWNSWDHDKR